MCVVMSHVNVLLSTSIHPLFAAYVPFESFVKYLGTSESESLRVISCLLSSICQYRIYPVVDEKA